MALPKRTPSRFRSSAEAVLMSMSLGSDVVEPTDSTAAGCTTGDEELSELGSGGVSADEGSTDALAE